MSKERQSLKLKDCILQLNTGLNPRKNFSLGSGELKYITAKNLTKYGEIDFSKCDFINEEAKNIINRRSEINIGDILFSSRAPIGQAHLIKEAPDFYDIGESIFSIRANNEVVQPEYLCLYLTSDLFIAQASKHATGSIIVEIRISDLLNTEVAVPSINVQKSISKTVNTIDQKIQNNKKIISELEDMAKTIYDYWFTQYDFPDENGKPYKSSGGAMVYNEELKKEIPQGWEVQSMIKNSLFTILKPGVEVFDKKEYLATAEVNGTNISRGNIVDYKTRESRANMQPKVNTVWFAKMKNSVKHLFLNKEMSYLIDNVILSTGFCGLQCNEKSFEFISSFIANKYFETIKDVLAHGATQEAVNNDDLGSIFMPIPNENILTKYHALSKSLFANKSELIIENQQLTELRDWILPMLMNGQAVVE